MEFQLIPSKSEYEYPLTNKIIDFVKSQNFPIDNLDTLSKIMASNEIFKQTHDNKNKELLFKIDTQTSQIEVLRSKLDEQLKLNETLSKRLFELK